jgi:hypothetical protein
LLSSLIVVVGIENRAVGLCHVNEPSDGLEDFALGRFWKNIWKNMVNTFRSTQRDATGKATSKLAASSGCDFQ